MENLNFESVRKEFFNLLFKNRKTTSLDVKMALRNKNFFATQSDVSYYISLIKPTDYIPFIVKDNGTYKEYVLTDDVDDFVDNLITNFFNMLKNFD